MPLPDPPPPAPGGTLLALVLLAASAAAAFLAATPPAPRGADAPEDAFSAERALAFHARVLSPERPRPVGSEEHAAVRGRLLAELGALGLAPEVQEAVGPDVRGEGFARVSNVLARVDGQREGHAVLAVAHYDSVAAGPGAADDGVGVAVLLEVARALRAGPAPRHDVILLFTDGEELSLVGARAFAEGHPWAEEVGAVVNVEMRGTSGLALLFETGPGSGGIVRALGRTARRPSATSLAAEVYRRMPNDTDFTVFRERGLPGVNLAAVGGWARYHTPRDERAALDPATVQHVGESCWLTVRELAEGRADGPAELTYTDVLGRFLLAWPSRWNAPLALAALLANAWIARRLGARGAFGPGRSTGAALAAGGARLLLVLGLAAVLGLLLPALLGALSGHPLPGYVTPGPARAASAAAALLLVLLASGGRRGGSFWELERSVALASSAAALALAGLAPGAAFLPLLPALGAAILPPVLGALGNPLDPVPRHRAALLALGVAAVVGLPIWIQVDAAFGAWTSAATTVPLALLGAWLLPLAADLGPRWHAALAALALAAVPAAGLLLRGTPAFDAAHPQKVDLVHLVDAEGRATWRLWAPDAAPPPELVRALGEPRDGDFYDWVREPVLVPRPYARRRDWSLPRAPAPDPGVPAPAARPLRVAGGGGLALRSLRGAEGLHLVLPEGARPVSVRIGARTFGEDVLGEGPRLSFWGLGDTPVEVQWQGSPAGALVFDTSSALPPSAAPILAARPAHAVPAYLGDLSLLVTRPAPPGEEAAPGS